MSVRRLVIFLIIILLLAIFRPSGFWRELKRIWEHRETITRILTVLVLAYLAYGVYRLYSDGWFQHWLAALG
jgi:hypothetical protein